MWREIKCGGGWPTGSDGDWCKVWWLDWTGWKWRQGVWDPDQSYCIITSGQAPNNGCTDDRKESTASGIADLCGGNTAGDGKCEQACGADASCDEKDTGDTCGTNGRCASYCLCCEASDSDGGKVYTVKGTTSGPVLSGGVVSCNTTTDYCVDSKTVREYYIDYLRYLVYQDYDCSQRTDGLKHCVDGKCGCTSDDDCKAAGITCDAKGYSNRYAKCADDHTCTKCGPCQDTKTDCTDGHCCDFEIGGPGQCVGQGIYSGNSKYLCDPPNGFTSKAQAKQKSLFEVLFEFLNSWVQNFR